MTTRWYAHPKTIGFRILMAFCCLFVLLIIQSTFTLYSSRHVVDTQRYGYTTQLNLMTFREKLSHTRIKMFMLLGTPDPTKMETLKADLEGLFNDLAKESQALNIQHELLASSQRTYQDIMALHWNFQTTQAYELINSTSEAEYERLYGELATLSHNIETTIQETIRRSNRQFVSLAIGFCLVGLLIVALWGWYLIHSIANPIKQAVWCTQMIAKGDLSIDITVTKNDETGQLLATITGMVARLREVVRQVKVAAKNVTDSSQEMRSSAMRMSQGVSEQAAATEQALAALQEMVATIKQNADHAVQTEEIARKTATDAAEGGQAVAQTVAAMKEIVAKTLIVEQIAQETRMLSLNATIEAARASEYGRAFSTVAAEIRQLADTTKKAAEEIKHLSHSSVVIAERSGAMLMKIVPNSQKTAELIQEISAASSEQKMGINQVNHAIQQLDQVAQQNASMAEQVSSMAEELAAQASQMQRAVEFFKIDETEFPKEKESEFSVSTTNTTDR